MQSLLVVTALVAAAYVTYRAVVLAARRVAQSPALWDIVSLESVGDSKKARFKIRDWFVWSVCVNEAKGSAGGNIKFNFPIRSSLLLALLCLVIAVLTTKLAWWVVPTIFVLFAIHYLRRWFSSLTLIETLASNAQAISGQTDQPASSGSAAAADGLNHGRASIDGQTSTTPQTTSLSPHSEPLEYAGFWLRFGTAVIDLGPVN